MKGGKTFSINEKLYMTTGAKTACRIAWTEEKPLVIFTHRIENQMDTTAIGSNSFHKITSKNIYAELSFPISFEYNPAEFLSLFGAYVVQFTYSENNLPHEKPELTMNSGNIQHLGYEIRGEETRSYKDNTLLTAGFSLKLKEGLEMNFYTRAGFDFTYLKNAVADIVFKF